MSDDLIWYACYGSNLAFEKFLHYIDGLQRTICHHHFKAWGGCTDKTPPLRSIPYIFHYNIFFANSSRSWDNQGVAFLDMKNPGFSYGRIYLITKEQYKQIRDKEGRGFSWYNYPKNDFD